MKIKKKACVLLSCLLLMTSVSCTSTQPPASTSSVSPSATVETTPESTFTYDGTVPLSETTETFTVLASSSSLILGFDDMVWWQEILNKANIKIEMEQIDPVSYGDVVLPRLAAGVQLPDIVKLPSRDEDLKFVKSGLFLELTDYIDTSSIYLKEQFEANPSLRSEITTPEGKIFYAPYIFTKENNARTLMVNVDYLTQLGLTAEDIKTTDDFYDYLVSVKENDLNRNGDTDDEVPLFARGGMLQLWAMYWGLQLSDTDGFQVGEDGKIFNGFIDNRYLDFLTYMHRLYQEGLLYNEFGSANYDVQTALFSNNQTGSLIHFISNCTGYSQTIDPNWNIDTDKPIMQAIVPLTGPYGDQHAYGRDVLGPLFGISTTCENPDLAFALIDYLYSQEAGETAWFGIEGTDYNRVDGEIVPTPLYLQNENQYAGKNGHNFDGLPSFQHKNGYMIRQSQYVRDASNDVIDPYLWNPTISFSYKLSEEAEMLNMYQGDLNTYFQENMSAFIMGTKSLDEWDNYVTTAQSMNLEKVIEVHQAAYERSQQMG